MREYELPDDERWFTKLQWEQYKELNELASTYRTTVKVSDVSLRQVEDVEQASR